MNVPSTKSLESATKQGRSSRAWINHVLNDCAQDCAQTGATGANQRESVFRKLLVRLVIDFGGVALNPDGNRCSPTVLVWLK
jgi:hypothetical protein